MDVKEAKKYLIGLITINITKSTIGQGHSWTSILVCAATHQVTPWHLSITITNKYLFMLCNIRYLDILTNRAFNSKSCQSHTCQWFSIKLLHLEQQPILCSILKDRQDFQAQITQSPERKSFFGIGAKWDNYTYAKNSWSLDELAT